ncbi:hypothetical protein GCM10025734_36850 [Kitasatospora paranensis]
MEGNAMTQSVSIGRLMELLSASPPGALPEEASRLTLAMASESDRLVEVTFPPANEVLDVYRHRFESIDEFRESRVGWELFFSSLEGMALPVGLLSVVVGEWRATILVDADMKRILACLARPPR